MHNFWHDLPQPFFALAPMEAVTDVVFRHVITQAAPPDVWFSEFTNATGWVHAGQKAIGGRLLKTDDEQPIVAQIWGGEPGDMEQLAAYCAELGYHGIDINMGCPAKSAVKSGGAALIRQPELAIASIAAAKTAGLPVSVKTRLGYTYVDEWRDWLSTLLQQDIVNLTIHLRTKREMSKVPAHHELIPQIVKLRDQIAPQTLLTINGDIADRDSGLRLVHQSPGINGVMIGRGVFHNPFAFATSVRHPELDSEPALDSIQGSSPKQFAPGFRVEPGMTLVPGNATTPSQSSASSQPLLTEGSAFPAERGQDKSNLRPRVPEGSNGRELSEADTRKQSLIRLLELHLDLFDQWQPHTNRPYETLKRFYKIYIRDFDGAADLRHELMQTKSTDDVRAILARY